MKLPDLPYRRPSLAYAYHEIDRPYIPVLVEMESNGVRIDVDRLQSLVKPCQARTAEIVEVLTELNDGPINIGSNAQVAALVFDKWHLPKSRKKPGSVEKEILTNLASAYPEWAEPINLILEYRRVGKLKGTYIDNLINEAGKNHAGRVYAHFNATSTITSRLSSSDPVNLQNIPKRIEAGTPPFIASIIPEIRSSFIARPGWKIVKFDKAQQEYRVLVCLSNDQVSIAIINGGLDIHLKAVEAAGVTGLDYDQLIQVYKDGGYVTVLGTKIKAKEVRNTFKNIVYGVAYDQTEAMTQVHLLTAGISVTLGQAKSIQDAILYSKPDIVRWKRDQRQFVLHNGYAETYFGHRAWYPEVLLDTTPEWKVEQDLRSAGNMPIQGTSAEEMKIAQFRIYNERKAARMQAIQILAVHDEAVYECPEDEVDRLVEIINRVGPDTVPEFPIRMDVDIAVGGTW